MNKLLSFVSIVALLCCVAFPAATADGAKNYRLIDGDEIIEAIKAKAAPQMTQADFVVKLNPLTRTLTADAAGTANVEISNLNINKANNYFSAIASLSDNVNQQITVTGRLVGMVKVPVLNTQRSSGETIQDADIAWMDVEESSLGVKPITNADQLIGKRVERLIQPQTIIHTGMVKSPVLVRKNSLVTITYETGSMLISNQVKALEDGAMDEVVRVQNSQSGRIIDAVVVGSDHVQSGNRAKTLAMK